MLAQHQRQLNLLEYQSKKLLQENNVNIQNFRVVDSAVDLKALQGFGKLCISSIYFNCKIYCYFMFQMRQNMWLKRKFSLEAGAKVILIMVLKAVYISPKSELTKSFYWSFIILSFYLFFNNLQRLFAFDLILNDNYIKIQELHSISRFYFW